LTVVPVTVLVTSSTVVGAAQEPRGARIKASKAVKK
jgi:hypothetical protein